LNGVDPQAYLTDVLRRIVSGQTKSHELHTLLPWNSHPDSLVTLAAYSHQPRS
jgi:transposase